MKSQTIFWIAGRGNAICSNRQTDNVIVVCRKGNLNEIITISWHHSQIVWDILGEPFREDKRLKHCLVPCREVGLIELALEVG